MVITAWDPGETTGYVRLVSVSDSETERCLKAPGRKSAGFVITEYRQIARDDWRDILPLMQGSDRVIIERITVRNSAFNPVGLIVTGAIQWNADKLMIQYKMQTPQILAPIFALKLPIMREVKGPHAKDALAHAISYIGIDIPLSTRF